MPRLGLSPSLNHAPVLLGSLSAAQQAAQDLQRIQALAGIGPIFVPDATFNGVILAYEDSGGTIAASVGGVVGLLIDISKPALLGPELITNGDFSAGSTGWAVGPEWVVGDGVALGINASWSNIENAGEGYKPGRLYRVSFTASGFTSGSVSPWVKGTYGPAVGSPGNVVRHILSGSGANLFILSGNSGFSGTIDNVSVREVLGYYASQDTTAKKSILRIDSGIRYLDSDTATAEMPVALPSAITNATVFKAAPTGVVKTTGVNLGTSFSITEPYQQFRALVVIDANVHGATTTEEDALITQFVGRYVPS